MTKWWNDSKRSREVGEKISKTLLAKRAGTAFNVTFSSVFKGKYKKEESGCFVWSKARNQKGYGQVWHQGRNWFAHRLSFTLSKGNILKGMVVCHSCDNPPCINPDHLWLGTMGDNMLDMMRKGRGGIAKLSKEDKEKIKLMHGTMNKSIEEISERYEVSGGVIRFVVNSHADQTPR
jgi:hypothetical protein